MLLRGERLNRLWSCRDVKYSAESGKVGSKEAGEGRCRPDWQVGVLQGGIGRVKVVPSGGATLGRRVFLEGVRLVGEPWDSSVTLRSQSSYETYKVTKVMRCCCCC